MFLATLLKDENRVSIAYYGEGERRTSAVQLMYMSIVTICPISPHLDDSGQPGIPDMMQVSSLISEIDISR